jgi:hypothetical protein
MQQSQTTLGFNKSENGTLKYYFTYQVPTKMNFLNFKDIQSSITCEVDTKRTKYDSREEVISWELFGESSPWRLRFENSSRYNCYGTYNSSSFLKEESTPTTKNSIVLDFS